MCQLQAAPLLFLLLIVPSGWTLSPDQEEEQQREITFVAVFKSGNSIGTAMMRQCLLPRSLFPARHKEWALTTLTRQANFEDDFTMHLQWGRKVFMARNPYEIFRSAYLYEISCQNRLSCLAEMTMHSNADKMIRNISVLREKPQPNELHNHYIRRVQMADGILSDMVGEVGLDVEMMLANYERNFVQEKVLTVCLGDIFRAFDSTVQSILKHFGIPPDPEVWKCLKRLDPSENVIEHSTHSVVDQEKRKEAMRIIKENDSKYFGGRYGLSPITMLCPQEGLE